MNKRVSFIIRNNESLSSYVICKSKDCVILHHNISDISGSTLMINPLSCLMIAEELQQNKHKTIIQYGADCELAKMMTN